MTLDLILPSYRLFPYERELAERELQALNLQVVRAEPDRFTIDPPRDVSILSRLTYVARAENGTGRLLEPDLAVMESAHRALRRRAESRQATRYHLHGIHEYKGKFNPQVVRAFANLLGVQRGDWLIDPFCGSGTALVEGLSLSANVLGVDRSPMAAYLSRTKVAAMRHRAPGALARVLDRWLDESFDAIAESQSTEAGPATRLADVDRDTREYLSRWFTAPALAGLSAAMRERKRLRGVSAQLVGVAVSSLCRKVSLQLPEDLRIRRRPDGFVAPSIADELAEAVVNISTALRELADAPGHRQGRARVVHGSASAVRSYGAIRDRSARCSVITSPPYATALPYIDTDRLSIALLGLAPGSALHELERTLFGSREWNTSEAQRCSKRVSVNEDGLPAAIAQLCLAVDSAAIGAGFRRQAVAGLLYRYFVNMRAALRQLLTAMRPGEEAVFIVGANRTSGLDGHTIVIETPELLALVGEQAGYDVREVVRLDTWPRFGLHHANGINAESAVWLTARGSAHSS